MSETDPSETGVATTTKVCIMRDPDTGERVKIENEVEVEADDREIPDVSVDDEESSSEEMFSQELKEEVAQLDPVIDEHIADYYGVDPDVHIQSIEGYSEGEYSFGDADRAIQLLDFAGVDKLVDLNSRIVGIGQRVRDDDPARRVDFALRTDNGSCKAAEYYKIMNAWKHGGIYPDVYAHAVRNDGDNIIEFALVDMDRFCESVVNGELEVMGPHHAGNRRFIAFYSLNCLDRAGCLLTWWDIHNGVINVSRDDHDK